MHLTLRVQRYYSSLIVIIYTLLPSYEGKVVVRVRVPGWVVRVGLAMGLGIMSAF